tara:strand:- start:69 stop:332 length:264 start_codon:yes stop_codon:yes gene_type:complete
LGLLLKTRTPFNTKAAFLLCFQRKRKENNNNNTTDSLLHIKRIIAFSVSVGIILYIHTSSIERREKERLAKEKASSSSRSDFEEEEE